jgi:hypothetical protein
MTTSRTTFLSDPIPGERVSPDTFHYWRARAKREAYDLVLGEFKKSGITKTELARRLGKTLPEVSRMLGGPANWTIATVSDLLFAITGGLPKWSMVMPKRLRRNDNRPNWLHEPDTELMRIVKETPEANTAPVISILGNPKGAQQPAHQNNFDYSAQLGQR